MVSCDIFFCAKYLEKMRWNHMAFLSSPAGHIMFIEGLINWSLKAYFAVPILDYNIVRKNCKKSLRREI